MVEHAHYRDKTPKVRAQRRKPTIDTRGWTYLDHVTACIASWLHGGPRPTRRPPKRD